MSNRNSQDGVVTANKLSTNDINRFVRCNIRHRLGGFEQDKNGKTFKYLLKNQFVDLDGSYRVLYTDGVDCTDLASFYHHFDKTKQPAPTASEADMSDNRTDVFDELTPVMLAEENYRANILFPYYKEDNYWLVGELVLDKRGRTLSVFVFAHDPYGRGELSIMKFEVLKERLKRVFVKYDVEVILKKSQYTSRRQHLDDVTSSGVIVADELVKRITNESLTLTAAYPVGARQLRRSQIKFLEEICEDEVKSYTEKIALDDNSVIESVLSIKEVRSKVHVMINSKETKVEKIEKLYKIEADYYKPLVKQLAKKTSIEELMDLVIVFNDLLNLSIAVCDLNNQLERLTEAAVFCQYMKTILEEKFNFNQRSKFLDRWNINPSQRWNDIQKKFVAKIGGKNELLPKMTLDAEEYRNLVIKMRKEARQEFDSIEKHLEHLKTTNPQDIDGHRNSIVNPVRDMFKHIAENMKSLLSKLYSDSEDIMATPPPCRYAIIGLGSLALQQITPYSDFEFAILIDSDALKNPELLSYFKNLSHLVKFKVIGLGETSIPNSKFDEDLKHLVHVGINFDLGGKTPLGRPDKPYSLIQTVPEMLKYVFNKDDKVTHIDKCLPYILENVCYVSGDKELVEKYQKGVSEFFYQTNQNKLKYCEVRALKILEAGAVEFDYAHKHPNQERNQIKYKSDLEKLEPNLTDNEGKYFNVKQEIYRLSERMAYNMGLYFGIEGDSCWDTLNKLKTAGIINESAHNNLQYAVSFANLLRLKTYFKNEAQTGEMSIYSKNFKSSESTMLELTEADLEEHGELFNYFYRASPLFRNLEEFCSKHEKLTNLERRFFFQNESFFESGSATKGLIYFRLNQFENAVKHLVAALETSSYENRLSLLHLIGKSCTLKGDFDSSLQYYKESLKMQRGIYKDAAHPLVATSLDKIGIAYNLKGDHESALQYFKESFEMQKIIHKDVAGHPDIAASLNNIGYAHKTKGDYNSALLYYKESLGIWKDFYKDVAHPAVATALDNIGTVYNSKGDYAAALHYYKESLEMRKTIAKDDAHPDVASSLNNAGLTYFSKGDYDLAIQHYKASLAMQKVIHKDVAHPDIAAALVNIGFAYKTKGDYNLALQYYKKSLDMRRTIYKGEAHPDVANSLNNIGSAYLSKDDYDLALEYYKESLEMQRAIYKGKAYPHIATCLNNVGLAYDFKGDYELALQFYKESFEMIKTLYKNEAHPHVATSLNNIGNVYKYKGDFDSALQCYEESFEMRKYIFKDDAHVEVATSLNNIGFIHRSKGDCDLALQYCNEALEMAKVIFKDTAHPLVPAILNNIGLAHYSKGDHDLALQCFKESFELRKALFKDVAHPDVVASLKNIRNVYESKGKLLL